MVQIIEDFTAKLLHSHRLRLPPQNFWIPNFKHLKVRNWILICCCKCTCCPSNCTFPVLWSYHRKSTRDSLSMKITKNNSVVHLIRCWQGTGQSLWPSTYNYIMLECKGTFEMTGIWSAASDSFFIQIQSQSNANPDNFTKNCFVCLLVKPIA